jgi:hypothetical protein
VLRELNERKNAPALLSSPLSDTSPTEYPEVAVVVAEHDDQPDQHAAKEDHHEAQQLLDCHLTAPVSVWSQIKYSARFAAIPLLSAA